MSRLPGWLVVAGFALGCVPRGIAQVAPATVQIRHITLASALPLPSIPAERAERYFTHRDFLAASLKDESARMVRRFFIRAGYLEATVRATRLERAHDGTLDLQFEVNAGPLYHYSQVEATGAKVFAPAELIATLKLKPGEPVDTARMLEGLSAIRRKYFCRGYLRVEAVPVGTLNAGDHTERLVVLMREGPRFRIAKLSASLHGPVADVLLAEPSLQPGEFFQPCEMTRAARRDISREQAARTPFTFYSQINPGADTLDVVIEPGFDFGYGEVGWEDRSGGEVNYRR